MKTTKEHFKIFKEECERWIDILGLKCWNVYYEHEESSSDCYADISYNIVGRVATIGLNKNWPDDTFDIDTETQLIRSAKHECFELLLGKLATMAAGKIYSSEDTINEEIHVIIRTLENTLFKEKQ